MKKDISVIRDSISRIVSMLTKRSIKVTQRGSRAYVSYHPVTGAIIELNIPYLPDDASEDFIAAIQGFIDHEIGHVLKSDPKEILRAKSLGDRVVNLHNVIEDVYIEREMTNEFRGSGANLDAIRHYYLNRVALPKIKKALAAGDMGGATGYASVIGFRAWGGQAAAADFLKVHPEIVALIKPIEDKLGADMIAEILKLRNSRDCVELAVKMVAKLEATTPKPPKPEAPKPKPETPAPKLPASIEPEPTAEPEGTDPGEGGDVTETVEGDTDHGRDPEDRDEVDGEVTGDGDAGEGGSDGSAGEGGGEAGEEPEETPEEGDLPSGGTYDGLSEEAPAPPPESDDEPDHGGGMSTDGDDPDHGGEGDGVESSGADDTVSGEGEAAGEGLPSASGDGDVPSSGGDTLEDEDEEEPDPLAEVFDEERDFDKDMAEELSKSAASEIRDSSYAVYSRDWDRIELAPFKGSDKAILRMDNMMLDKVGVMQKQLERAIAAQARKMWNPGMRRGRISPGALYRTSAGDDRVFRQRFETRAKDTALSLLVDCSGSMGHANRIGLAGAAAYGLAMVMERLKLQYEVLGFTTTDSGYSEKVELMRIDAEANGSTLWKMGWGRVEPLFMPIFKTFEGRLDTDAKARIAALTERPDWLSQNVDGECVQIAGARLKQRKADRHVLMVLSDGMPACVAGNGLNEHLKAVVQSLEKSGVETIGIGIQTNAVKQFYPKHVVLDDVEQLPGKLMQELTKILLS